MAVILAASLAAQFGGTGADGLFHPVSNTRLDTTVRPEGWDFVAIHIPAGVTVELVGDRPAILRSQGRVIVDGTLSADARGYTGGPGGWSHEAGPGGAHALPTTFFASHATTPPRSPPIYGSAIPFDPRGGSGGADYVEYLGLFVRRYAGGGGGGVLVVLADLGISVGPSGAITAQGSYGQHIMTTPGSGGAIMLRSGLGIDVQGLVSADAGPHSFFPAGLGWVRMDATLGAPQITGTVIGVTETVELPHLAAGAAALGSLWHLEVTPRPGDRVAVYLALNPASILTPAGLLGLHPSEMVRIGMGVATRSGIEPTAPTPVTVPADPALRGITLYAQSIAFDQSSYSRLSATVVRTIQ